MTCNAPIRRLDANIFSFTREIQSTFEIQKNNTPGNTVKYGMGQSCSEKKAVSDLLKSPKDMGIGDFQLLKTRDPNLILKLKLMQVNC